MAACQEAFNWLWKDIYTAKGGQPELEKDFHFYTQNTNGAPSLLGTAFLPLLDNC